MIPPELQPTYVGKGAEFIRRMGAIAGALPVLFERISWCRLRASFTGVKALRIVEKLERGMSFAYYDPLDDTVSIYPMAWRQGERLDLAIYVGFGFRHWYRNVSHARKAQWIAKEWWPDSGVRDRVLTIFNARKGFRETLAALTNDAEAWLFANTVVDRLSSANVRPQDVELINLNRYPLTADLFNGTKPICYEPLVTRHGGGILDVRVYQEAFASYCASNGEIPLTNRSAAIAYTRMFQLVSGIWRQGY